MYLIRLLTLSLASFKSIFTNAGPINLNVLAFSDSKSNSLKFKKILIIKWCEMKLNYQQNLFNNFVFIDLNF